MTTAAKHVKGPRVPNPDTMFVRTADGRAVAAVYGNRNDCSVDECGRARARLIAAAPDLLAALKACQAALAMMIDPKAIKSSSVINAFAQATEAECKAGAAIAKAEGGAA